MILILENIRSAHNVGALFRTADGRGVSEVLLVGHTAAPIDRFGRVQKEIAKVALDAQESVTWKQFENIADAIQHAKEKGCTVCALEQTDKAVLVSDYTPKTDTALILGTERGGVSKEALALADMHLEIPMHGEKDSLNVSVAGGIALYALSR